ncbi:septum formation inhibitor Maf [Providencia stuartii]|uniref:7-methyl-GTP pyrophosphatase n=2 Tax=Providencia TaxID=586 RepID=A0A1S1HT12_PROST|nr:MULTISPECIES: nucleoside triphosphate pyrophosphatase [Providencia]ELR5038848.1 septum formation inhibitor Maf [Providencia stuartii]ELR5080750.1 septum formation inhibitor Maf [Providencia stuartii]ELR5111513.1 septum formation inhibitor Maf [Providencia stuartii]ELR5298332.1 septum formation inhibitor Maf [Providencia stuartii]MDW7586779.1 nucleoside triphosphate pyrophosphatase [Providencia sp. 2023EL-00965]
MKSIILASTSPYRQQLLKKLGLPFLAVAPNVDESAVLNESAEALVTRLAHAKAHAISKQYQQHLIIGSDQVCVIDGQIMGKPLNYDKAFQQLKKASGHKVTFYTGLCLLDSSTGSYQVQCELFNVYFRSLSDKEIESYLRKEEPYQCAGSFKSEGLGIVLFDRLEGRDPNTLIGLPLILLLEMLRHHGYSPLND